MLSSLILGTMEAGVQLEIFCRLGVRHMTTKFIMNNPPKITETYSRHGIIFLVHTTTAKGKMEESNALTLILEGHRLAADRQYINALLKFNKALRLMREAFKCEDTMQMTSLYATIGDLNFQLGQYDEALQAFTKQVQFTPEDPLGYQNVAKVHEALGNYNEAIRTYVLATNKGTKQQQQETMLKQAEMCRLDGKYKMAILLAKQVLEGHPETHMIRFDAMYSMGKTYFVLDDFERALDSLRTALNMFIGLYHTHDSIQVANALFMIAMIMKRKHQYSDALLLLTDVYKIGYKTCKSVDSPVLASTLHEMGSILNAQQRSDEAIKFGAKLHQEIDKLQPTAKIQDTLKWAYATNSVFVRLSLRFSGI